MMRTTIGEYVKSKGVKVTPQTDDFNSLMLCLKEEYGFIAPVFRNTSQTSVVKLQIDLDIFAVHKAYLDRVDERIPTTPEIIGIVVKHETKYRLIDGYHRFKWALNNRTEGLFILVE